MLQIISLVLLIGLGIMLVSIYFKKKDNNLLRDFFVKFLAIVLTLVTIYLFIRVLRYLIYSLKKDL